MKRYSVILGMAVGAVTFFSSMDANAKRCRIALEDGRRVDARYEELTVLRPGQDRISLLNIERKVEEAKDDRRFYNNKNGQREFAHNDNKSIYKLGEAIEVVRGPGFLVVTDGHHHVMASMQVGATTIPVYELYNWSHLSIDDFWKKMAGDGLVYLDPELSSTGIPPTDWKDLVDDPNRFFMAITALRLKHPCSLKGSKGSAVPIWIKVGKGKRFVENILADILTKQGHILSRALLPRISEYTAFVERARRILVQANPKGIRIIPERISAEEIKLCP